MGIRPNRDGAIPPVTPDNPETRYSDWLTDLEDSGEIVGGVWQETDAKATSANNAASDLAGRVEDLEDAPVKPHTHVSAGITDAVWQTGDPANAGKVVRLHGTDGWLYSYFDPTSPNHLVRKRYVDEGINNHAHMSADIADKATYAEAGTPAGRVVQTGSDGFIHSRTNPTSPHHLTRKGYVDEAVTAASNTINGRVEGIEEVTSTSDTGWSAYKRAGVVTLTLTGATSGFTLPAGWRPPVAVYSPMAPARADTTGYFTISTAGVLTLYGATGAVYSTVTYITA